MKMTMHIDDDLLNRVIEAHGFKSKTEAVEAALIELDRQHKMREFRKHGLGLTPEQLANALVPGYLLPGESESELAVAEEYRRKPILPKPASDASDTH